MTRKRLSLQSNVPFKAFLHIFLIFSLSLAILLSGFFALRFLATSGSAKSWEESLLFRSYLQGQVGSASQLLRHYDRLVKRQLDPAQLDALQQRLAALDEEATEGEKELRIIEEDIYGRLNLYNEKRNQALAALESLALDLEQKQLSEGSASQPTPTDASRQEQTPTATNTQGQGKGEISLNDLLQRASSYPLAWPLHTYNKAELFNLERDDLRPWAPKLEKYGPSYQKIGQELDQLSLDIDALRQKYQEQEQRLAEPQAEKDEIRGYLNNLNSLESDNQAFLILRGQEVFLLQRQGGVAPQLQHLSQDQVSSPQSPSAPLSTVDGKPYLYRYRSTTDEVLYGDHRTQTLLNSNSNFSELLLTPQVSPSNFDGFHGLWTLWRFLNLPILPLSLALIVSLVLAAVSFTWLIIAAGYTRRRNLDDLSLSEQAKLAWFDYIPLELLFFLDILIASPLLFISLRSLFGFNDYGFSGSVMGSFLQGSKQLFDESAFQTLCVRLAIGLLAVITLGVIYLNLFIFTCVRRAKLHKFIDTCWTLRFIRFCLRSLRDLNLNLQMYIYTAVWLVFAFLTTVAIASHSFWLAFLGCILLFLGFLLPQHLFVRELRNQVSLGKHVQRLAEGDLDHQFQGVLSTQGRHLLEGIEQLRQGRKASLDAQLKSERLKTELITNVSHDLKTPLTAIISYIDLLQRPNLSEEEKQNYLEILEQKAWRLKTLTEDLIEASKASSGNVQVQWEEISLGELLAQAAGEYDARFRKQQLTLQIQAPSEQPFICLSDSRLLWRILDNLLSNVCKYALPGSRAHLSYGPLPESRSGWQLRIKNVSAQAIDLSTEALMDRFVRGDLARSGEGSGLGLSIARSLTEVLGGVFTLQVEDDLFVVTLSFPNQARPKESTPEATPKVADNNTALNDMQPGFLSRQPLG